MDNQQMMQNRQKVVIRRTPQETESVQKKGQQLRTNQQQEMDQQRQQTFIQELSKQEEYIQGAEHLDEGMIDTSSVEVREEKRDSVFDAQDSVSFRNMSVEAEQRKEYLKNGQQMPEAMQQKYKKEFRRAQKE